MCYAISDSIPEVAFFPDKMPSLKRKASIQPEGEPVKKLKWSSLSPSDDESIEDASQADSTPESVTHSSQADEVRELQKTNRHLYSELEEVGVECDAWQVKTIWMRKGYKKVNAGKAEETVKPMTTRDIQKQMRDIHKVEYDSKLHAVEAKYRAALETKHASYQKRLSELKIKHQEQEEKLRVQTSQKIVSVKAECAKAKDECKQQAKEAKEIFTRESKQLKAKCDADVKRWKPEYSKIVKERDSEIAHQQNEITKLASRCNKTEQKLKNAGDEIDRLEDKRKELEQAAASSEIERADLSSLAAIRQRQIEDLELQKIQREREVEAKLDFEGRRWEIQWNCARDSAATAVQHQRAYSNVRLSNERKDKQNEALAAEIQELKSKLDDVEAENEKLRLEGLDYTKS